MARMGSARSPLAVVPLAAALCIAAACGGDDSSASPDAAARDGSAIDAGPLDGGPADGSPDAGSPIDAGAGGVDAGEGADAAAGSDAAVPDVLAFLRDRLLATATDDPCGTWASWDESQRAVFLTLTHRLFTSHTPDGRSMLWHATHLYLVLGGGSDGTSCGGSENNRLFLAMDDYLWARMVETWDDMEVISDDGGAFWVHTGDIAGPHDPFDASDETATGLSCTLLFENPDSEPPTAQGHFFLEGSAVPVERGSGISLPADPRMLELDQDYNCIHDSNPTCSDFADRYREHHGDFVCDWVPGACTPVGTGCYRSAW